MAENKNDLFELSKTENPSIQADSSTQNSSRLDFNSIFEKDWAKKSQITANPEVIELAQEMEGETAISCAVSLSFRLSEMTPALAKTFVTELKKAQNSKYSPELILSSANNETTVEFLDTKEKAKIMVAKITDKEVIPEYSVKSPPKSVHEEQEGFLKSSTDAQLLGITQWSLMKGTRELYNCVIKGARFNPKGALAELAVGALIVAAVAPPVYEYFIKDHKEKAKHK